MPDKSKMCAYTLFGGHHYWTEWNQFQTLFASVYVIDEKGLIGLKSKEQTPICFSLITVKIKRDKKDGIDSDRLERDKGRTNLSDDFYDYIINNNGTLEEYHKKLDQLVTKIMEGNNGNTNDR